MRTVLSRVFFSFLIAVTVVLLVAVAIAKLVSIIRSPHEAAADLESAIGGYWPLILVSIVALTVGSLLRPPGHGRRLSVGRCRPSAVRVTPPDAQRRRRTREWFEGANRMSPRSALKASLQTAEAARCDGHHPQSAQPCFRRSTPGSRPGSRTAAASRGRAPGRQCSVRSVWSAAMTSLHVAVGA